MLLNSAQPSLGQYGLCTSAGTVPVAYSNFSSVDINITTMVTTSSVLLPFGAASGPAAQQLSDSMNLLGYEVRRQVHVGGWGGAIQRMTLY